jgi:hypothetical protein
MNAGTYNYAYDDIGNRQTSSINAVPSSYTANSLNQYTALTGGQARSTRFTTRPVCQKMTLRERAGIR